MPDHTQRVGPREPRSVDLSETERYRALEAERQRVVLDVLTERSAATEPEERPASVPLERLAATVARREGSDPRVDSQTLRRTKHSLHHIHLPEMARLGVVDYDRDLRCVQSRQCCGQPR